jgi:uncharacterized delta-60 repeat protein
MNRLLSFSSFRSLSSRSASRPLLTGVACALLAAAAGCGQVLGIEPGVLTDAGAPEPEPNPDAVAPNPVPDAGNDASLPPHDAGVEAAAPLADFAVTLDAARVDVVRGATASIAVSIRPQGANPTGPITVTASNLPTGVTADPLPLAAGITNGTLTLRAATTAPIDVGATLLVSAASARYTHTAAAALVVRDAPGALDVTFGTSGIATVPIAHANGISAVGTKGLIIQKDGQIVFCGNTLYDNAAYKLVLTRVAANGALDTKFGQSGVVALNEPGHQVDTCGTVIELPSSGLLVDGFTLVPNDPNSPHAFMAARFDAFGQLDPGFGTGGWFFDDVGGVDSKAYDMVVQPDGKIVLAGFSGPQFALLRITADGKIDTTFGAKGDGTVIDTSVPNAGVTALELLPDGVVLAQGSTTAFVSVAYDPAGQPAKSYGTSGRATVASTLPHFAGVSGAALLPSGKTVLAGSDTLSVLGQVQLARFDAAGQLDPSFGSAGLASTSFPDGAVISTSVQALPDGGLVVGAILPTKLPVGLIRYDADGALMTAFGDQGHAGIGGDSRNVALAIDAVGRIVIGTFTQDTKQDVSFVTFARFWP